MLNVTKHSTFTSRYFCCVTDFGAARSFVMFNEIIIITQRRKRLQKRHFPFQNSFTLPSKTIVTLKMQSKCKMQLPPGQPDPNTLDFCC